VAIYRSHVAPYVIGDTPVTQFLRLQQR